MLGIIKSRSIFFTPILAYLLIRIFYGLDLNDEMQYYDQIISLTKTNKIFSNDLLFQQLLYIYFYPLFKLSEIFSFDLILSVRITFIVLLLYCVYYFKQEFKSNIDPFVLNLLSVFVIFGVTFHNIFSLSYNTFSFILAFILTINLFSNEIIKIKRIFFISFLTIILGTIQPFVGLIYLIFFLFKFNKGNKIHLLNYIFCSFVSIFFIIFYTFQFTSFENLTKSIYFSGLLNYKFQNFFNYIHLAAFGIFFTIFYFSNKLRFTKNIIFLSLVLSFIILLYAPSIFYKFFVFHSFFVIVSFIRDNKSSYKSYSIKNLNLLFILISSITCITSGNGFFQIEFSIYLLLPFYLLIFYKTDNKQLKEIEKKLIIFLFLLLLIFKCLYKPYTFNNQNVDNFFQIKSFKNNQLISNYILLDNFSFKRVSEFKIELASLIDDSSYMIFSNDPWLYYLISRNNNFLFTTPMFFLHNQVSNKFKLNLQEEIELKKFDYILVNRNNIDHDWLLESLDNYNLIKSYNNFYVYKK